MVLMFLFCSCTYAASITQSKTYYYDEEVTGGSISSSFNFSRDLASKTTSCYILVHNYINGTLVRFRLDASDFEQLYNDIKFVTGKLKGRSLDDIDIEMSASSDVKINIYHDDIYIVNSSVSFEELCIFQNQMEKILARYKTYLSNFESIVLQ